MNKRSILTAVARTRLGVTALTGCSDNTGANYVTPSMSETIRTPSPEIGDQRLSKGPRSATSGHALPESDKAAIKVEVSITDPLPLARTSSPHPLKVTGEDADPVTVTRH